VADVFNIQLIQSFPEQSAVGFSSGSIILTQQQPAIMRCDGCIWLTERVVLITRPGVVARVPDHTGADRIEFDVAIADQAVATGIYKVGVRAQLILILERIVL